VKSSVKIIEMMKNNSFVVAEQISSELNISVRALEKQIRNLREKA
jgi:biotin operon repressor